MKKIELPWSTGELKTLIRKLLRGARGPKFDCVSSLDRAMFQNSILRNLSAMANTPSHDNNGFGFIAVGVNEQNEVIGAVEALQPNEVEQTRLWLNSIAESENMVGLNFSLHVFKDRSVGCWGTIVVPCAKFPAFYRHEESSGFISGEWFVRVGQDTIQSKPEHRKEKFGVALPIGTRILVVDDEKDIVDILSGFLVANGCRVIGASDGNQAIRYINTHTIDLVLTDLKMPGSGGLEVLKSAKEVQPRAQVFIMTGFGSIENAVSAMRLGACDYILKPFNVEELPRQFARALHLRDQEDIIAETEALLHEQWVLLDTGARGYERGRALELLCRLVLCSIPGFSVRQNVRNKDEEIDLIVRNESRDPFWSRFSAVFLVECKNWSVKKPGRAEIDAFVRKIQRRKALCNLGFFVTSRRVARSIVDEIRALAREGQIVVPIDRAGLERLVFAQDRSEQLKALVEETSL